MTVAEIVAHLLETEEEPFDAREYLVSGFWTTVLERRGWVKFPDPDPNGFLSYRKDYPGLERKITVWAEQNQVGDFGSSDPYKGYARIIVYSQGDRIAARWVTPEQVIEAVDAIEDIIGQDPKMPYHHVKFLIAHVLHLVGGDVHVQEGETPPEVPHTIHQALRQGQDWYAPTMSPTLRTKFNVTPRPKGSGRSGWRKNRKLPSMGEGQEPFDPREYLDPIRMTLERLGFKQHVGDTAYGKAARSPHTYFKFYVDLPESPNYSQVSSIMIEARPDNWASSGTWGRKGDYRSILSHSFAGDPPTDVIERLDKFIATFSGTFDEAEAHMTHEKQALIELGDRVFKARRAQQVPESIVDTLLDEAEPFNAREYLMTGGIHQIAKTLADEGWYAGNKDNANGWIFVRNEERNTVDVDFALTIEEQPNHEAMLDTDVHYYDRRGEEHVVNHDTGLAWEMGPDESPQDYVYRILDDMKQQVRIPDNLTDFYDPPDD